MYTYTQFQFVFHHHHIHIKCKLHIQSIYIQFSVYCYSVNPCSSNHPQAASQLKYLHFVSVVLMFLPINVHTYVEKTRSKTQTRPNTYMAHLKCVIKYQKLVCIAPILYISNNQQRYLRSNVNNRKTKIKIIIVGYYMHSQICVTNTNKPFSIACVMCEFKPATTCIIKPPVHEPTDNNVSNIWVTYACVLEFEC